MILRKVIREKVIDYLKSEDWQVFLHALDHSDGIRHAHIYTESILHPDSIRKLLKKYFKQKGIEIVGKVDIISHEKGFTNVHYFNIKDKFHFEVLIRYNPNIVLEPMGKEMTRAGKSFEYWDDEYMQKYYKQFKFKPCGDKERTEVEAYFLSDAWKQGYVTMLYANERSVHSHNIIETSLNPEDIMPIGEKALANRGFELDRAVSIVFNANGYDIGKIVYLVRIPNITLELEWEYNPTVIIKPAVVPIARITTKEMVEKDMIGIEYIVLEEDDIQFIVEHV